MNMRSADPPPDIHRVCYWIKKYFYIGHIFSPFRFVFIVS